MRSRICSARHATRRRPERETFGPELARIGAALGNPFMPWQRQVADVGGEIDPYTGLPAYREVIITIPRQSGKTTLFLTWQINRCLSPRWEQPQRSVFTAQSGKDARDKWLDELYPLIKQSPLHRFTEHMNRGMGNESVAWKTGSLIRLLSTSASSGHSKTLHQAVLDEIWHDTDDRREQGLRPAMITIPDAQLLVCSTAGTESSVVLDRKIRAGRAAVAEDTGNGVAYFEWSAPDDWDPADEESYYRFMPALCPDPPCRCGDGWRHTMTIEAIRAERAAMEPAEFARAYGNVSSSTAEKFAVIPEHAWRRVVDPVAAPSGTLRFAVDCLPGREAASITACGGGVIELVAHDAGVGWLVPRAGELARHWDGVVVVDASGPAAYVADELERDGVRVERVASGDVVAACSRIHDDIADGRARFRPDPDGLMEAAVAGLAKRPVGDRYVWSRNASSADITPFMSATLAWRPPKTSAPFALIGD